MYRKVLTAEYFGPPSAVCSRMTARRSFAAANRVSGCRAAFRAQQHILKHKTPGIDNSGYSPQGWRRVVPGRDTLVKVRGRWLFNGYPPSVQS